ncbi:MAG: SdrD B-like domain-containing protein [Cyanobacteria bacterium J06642_9]
MLDNILNDNLPTEDLSSTNCQCPHCGGAHHEHEHDDDLHGYPIQNDPVFSGSGSGLGQYGEFTDLTQTFKLHSNPNAKYTIYLDFDGHITQDTLWNGGDPITSSAYDRDDDVNTFSDAELAEIQQIWQRVAEDYAPFEVNVTTEAPDINDLQKGDGDDRWGVRVIMTQDDAPERTFGNGGVAITYTFDSDIDQPVYVFNKGANAASKTASHEVGHSLGLSHDGLLPNIDPNDLEGDAYYDGHGTGATAWQTIMGGHSNGLVQWSKGEYKGANNTGQDDLAQINTYLPYKTDDYGNTNATAHALTPDATNTFSAYGLIEKNTDIDVFSFITGAGAISININSATRFYLENGGSYASTEVQGEGSNLDIWAGLYNSEGNLVAESNPEDSLEALFTGLSVAAGKYYLHIDGVGFGDPYADDPTGYTDYGSLGQYSVEGTVIAPSADLINIEVAEAVKLEGDSGTTTFTFTVTRTGDTAGTTTVDWQVLGHGASGADADDFTGVLPTGRLSFAAGETSKTITLDVSGDELLEASESFMVKLSNLASTAGAFEFGANAAFGTILADEAEISGNLWHDLDGNGVRDMGEAGLAGRTVYLDQNQNNQFDAGEQSTTTDNNGDYTFTNLEAGSYSVAEVYQPGWNPTTSAISISFQGDSSYQLDDGTGSGRAFSHTGDVVLFNEFEPQAGLETIHSISVAKGGNIQSVYLYEDVNGDGRLSSDEKRIDMAVDFSNISGDFATVAIAPTTVSNTFYVGVRYAGNDTNNTFFLADSSFSGAKYVLQTDFAPDSEFSLSNMSEGALIRAHSGSAPQQVTVNAGDRVTDIDFGSIREAPATISGELWSDLNGNGQQDNDEIALAGWTVFLDENGNNQLDDGELSTTAAANGSYAFDELLAGSYTVAAVLQDDHLPGYVGEPVNGFGYQADNGVGGFESNWLAGLGYDVMALKAFQTKSDSETLHFVSFALGQDNPEAIFIYQDLNNDGQANTSEKLVEVDTTNITGTDGFATVAIAPTTVTGTFYIGALYESAANTPIIPVDSNNQPTDSWLSYDTAGNLNTDDLNLNFTDPEPFDNWMLRAHSGFIAQQVTVSAGEIIDNINFTISTPINAAPTVINPIDDQTAIFGEAFSFTFDETVFEDLNGDTLTYSITGLPQGFSFDPQTRTITGTPSEALLGQAFTIEVTADDNNGGTITDSFELLLQAPQSAPTGLQFNLDEISAKVGETINLINAEVFDANGVDDLKRIDFWLRKSNGSWQDISDVTTFTEEIDTAGFSYSLNLTDFETGSYTLWAKAYDKAGNSTTSVTQTFEVVDANTAPTDLQFEIDATYQSGDTLTLTNASVIDADGANTLDKVDLWLKDASGSWQNISDVTNFNNDGSFIYNLALTDLTAGTYTLWARAYDQTGAASNSLQKSFEVQAANVNAAPTDLQFDFDASSYKPGDTLSLTGAQVTDANDNLAKVDFWLNSAAGGWQDIDDVTSFNTGGSFDYSLELTGYAAGTYTLWARAYDQENAASNSVQQTFTVTPANTAPTGLQFGVNVVGPSVTLTNAQVTDADGAADVAWVDMWVKGPDGQWLNLSDINVSDFQPASGNTDVTEFSYDLLATGPAGTYTLWSRAYDVAGATSGSHKTTFDILTGRSPVETFVGVAGAEVFELGDTEVLFDDNGINDYALITGFDIDQDQIQLYGNMSDYRLGASTQGTAIYSTAGGSDELIGIVEGRSDLDLNALDLTTHFNFV